MKKFAAVAIMAVLAVTLSAPVFAGSTDKEVKLTGYITDEWCGKANANAQGADCARSCAKKGSDLAIYADGKLYKLSDKELAMQHVGYEVVVTGTVNEDGVVKVKSIEKVEKKA